MYRELYEKLSKVFKTITQTDYTEYCTGDVVVGDEILYKEGVFGGSFRRPSYEGDRWIAAKVITDSYGADKQQHTFTLEVIASEGVQPIEVGKKIRRKGRNVYRNGTMRKKWVNEQDRIAAQEEKHERGDIARAEREVRRAEEDGY